MPASTAIVLVIVSYTWLLEPLVPRWGEHLATGIVLLLAIRHARRSGEWGLSPRHFLPAACWSLAATVPVLTLTALYGAWQGTLRHRPHLLAELAYLLLWGGGQQFALQTVLLREAQTALSRRHGIWAAAAVFALLHLPNPFLTAATFGAGVAWCWIYDRHPNWLPLAGSHAVGTLALLACLDDSTTARLRVGQAYLRGSA